MKPLFMHVNADSLHVRNHVNGKSLGFVNRGIVVQVTEIDVNTGLWAKINTPEITGWSSLKYLIPSGGDKSPWLKFAQRELGVKELAGANYHPRIGEYMATVDNLSQGQMQDDGTEWCACFINWCVEKCGVDGTNSARARHWERWRNSKTAESVLPGSETPALMGDIAVFHRESPESLKGHVAIYIAYDSESGNLLVLGGNQANTVRYSWYARQSQAEQPYCKLLSLRSL